MRTQQARWCRQGSRQWRQQQRRRLPQSSGGGCSGASTVSPTTLAPPVSPTTLAPEANAASSGGGCSDNAFTRPPPPNHAAKVSCCVWLATRMPAHAPSPSSMAWRLHTGANRPYSPEGLAKVLLHDICEGLRDEEADRRVQDAQDALEGSEGAEEGDTFGQPPADYSRSP